MRSDDTTATQNLGSVVKAEWRALWLPGGTCVGTIIAAAAAIATGTIALLVLNAIAREPSHVVLSAPIEASSTTFALVFGLIITIAVGRDAEGRLAFTMLRTTVRPRLFAARALTTVVLGMLGTLVCSTAVAGVGLIISTNSTVSAFELAGLAIGVHVLGTGLIALISFELSTILRRSTPAVLVYLALLVLLPLALAVGAAAVPGGAGSVIAGASAWTPAPLLMQAFAVSTLPTEGSGNLVTGLLGLLCWTLATTFVACTIFLRRDAN